MGNVGDIQVDRRRIVHDVGVVFAGEDITGAAHVGCQLVYFVKSTVDHAAAEILFAKIADNEIVGVGFGIFMELEVDASNPETLFLQTLDKMAANEATGPEHECRFHVSLLAEYQSLKIAIKRLPAVKMSKACFAWARLPQPDRLRSAGTAARRAIPDRALPVESYCQIRQQEAGVIAHAPQHHAKAHFALQQRFPQCKGHVKRNHQAEARRKPDVAGAAHLWATVRPAMTGGGRGNCQRRAVKSRLHRPC